MGGDVSLVNGVGGSGWAERGLLPFGLTCSKAVVVEDRVAVVKSVLDEVVLLGLVRGRPVTSSHIVNK